MPLCLQLGPLAQFVVHQYREEDTAYGPCLVALHRPRNLGLGVEMTPLVRYAVRYPFQHHVEMMELITPRMLEYVQKRNYHRAIRSFGVSNTCEHCFFVLGPSSTLPASCSHCRH